MKYLSAAALAATLALSGAGLATPAQAASPAKATGGVSNNVESPKASAVANLAAGVCGRIAEKAKKGAYRGEDDQELSDLVRMIGMFVGEDYKSFANVLALQEKISSWTGEINTIGEEDIKPCLEEGGK